MRISVGWLFLWWVCYQSLTKVVMSLFDVKSFENEISQLLKGAIDMISHGWKGIYETKILV